jgi:hypothetical protein
MAQRNGQETTYVLYDRNSAGRYHSRLATMHSTTAIKFIHKVIKRLMPCMRLHCCQYSAPSPLLR